MIWISDTFINYQSISKLKEKNKDELKQKLINSLKEAVNVSIDNGIKIVVQFRGLSAW